MAGTAVKVKATRTTKSKLKTGPLGKGTRKTHYKGVWGNKRDGTPYADFKKDKQGNITKNRRATFAFQQKGRSGEGWEDQPLVQAGHEFFQPKFNSGSWFKQAHAPMDIQEVADSPSSIFAITGGYIPTFTEDYGNIAEFYRNYAGGMIVMNEAMTREGPGPMMMRGNHVWYNYASDYLDTVQKLGEAAPLGPDGVPMIDQEESMWDSIFDMYIQNSKTFVQPLLQKWRDELGIVLKEELRVTNEELKSIDKSDVQAPEEAMVQLMANRDKNVEMTPTDATGGARGLDVQLTIKMAGKIERKIVQWDATQSKITSGGTHTGLGTLSLKIDKDVEEGKAMLDSFEEQARTYFERSEKHLNVMLMDLHKYAMDARKKNKEYKDMDVRQILQAEQFKTGDAWSATQVIKDKLGDFYTEGTEEAKRMYVAAAYDSAMHILGLSSGQINPVWVDQTGGELPVGHYIGEPGTTIPVIFNAEWLTVGTDSVKSAVQLELLNVSMDLEAKTYAEIVMRDDLGYEDEKITRLLSDGNLMWNFYDMMLEGDSISIGKTYMDGYQKITGAGYHIAMGGVEFVEQDFNKELANTLEGLITKSIGNPRKHTGIIKKTMEEGQREGRRFSSIWKKGGFGSDLVEMETEHSNPDNPDLSKFAEEYAEWSKDKVISKKLKGFNRLLRNYTWTIPYIGIHYQGGKSQKIEPMLR